jgi:hypothetical protein
MSRSSWGSLNPNFRTLLACGQAAVRDMGSHADNIELSSELQWSEIVDQGRRHGLVPLLNRFITARIDPPPAIAELLHREAIGAVAENLMQIHGLKAAIDALAESDIPTLCIKGPVAATMLYKDPTLRPFSDSDLLIRLTDFETAYATLVEVGFRPLFDMPYRWQALYFRKQSQTVFIKEGSRVDLHWELLSHEYSFAPAMDTIWAGAQRVTACGVAVATLGPWDTLIFLCLHAAKHDWERLIWLVDIAALVGRSDRLDWDALVHELHHPSRGTPLQVSLMLIEALFGVDLPKGITELVHANLAAVALCRERVRRWQLEPKISLSPWPWNSLYYRSMHLSADRRRYWHDVLLRPTPLEWKTMPLPFLCRGAYYAVRPIRLIWKHCARAKA